MKIDHEYNCVWSEEQEYLLRHGIRYVFVKTINGITVWKFRKTAELFKVLSDFYSNVYTSS